MASDYKFVIELDDFKLDKQIKKLQDAFKKIEIQLEPVRKAGSSITNKMSGGSSEGGSGGIFSKMTNSMSSIAKSSLSLIGIGTGIGALVAMITDASPILQSVLKLLQTSVMLILRPIGDFIGFILRPISIMFLQQVIPFYKFMYPLVKKYGTIIGEWFGEHADLTGVIFALLFGVVTKIIGDLVQDALKALSSAFSKINWGAITKSFNEWINTNITEPIKKAWQGFIDWVDGLVSGIIDGWNSFATFITGIGEAITATLQPAWNGLMTIFTMIYGGVENTIKVAWDALIAIFDIIHSTIKSTVVTGWGAIVAFFFNASNTIKDTLTAAWNKIVEFFQNIADVLQKIWERIKSISKLFTGGGGSSSQPSAGWGSKLHASGGILTEPVVGIGLNTGTRHVFGEAGAEMITPLSKGGGGLYGNGSINITVNLYGSGSSSRSDAEMVAREIQKILKGRGVI